MSVKDGGTNGINLAGLKNVPVAPGLVPSGTEGVLVTSVLIKPSTSVTATLLEVGAENLFSKQFSLCLGDEEFA